ncbi:hemerythrin domain-containing protein [Micromonospora sp. URMC 105]|uniref:hemerythrin domain-containing protein n=1 Tax=Micromonospora sp. URMC 105 TaxID=3423413 RepID=UPI003F1E2A0F
MTGKMADVRDMYVIHTLLRREFRLLPPLVRSVADGDRTRSQLLGEHIQLMSDLLHAHHEGEDDLLWPKLLERGATEVLPAVRAMEGQHERLDEINEQVTSNLATWRRTAADDQRNALADALDRLLPVLVEHTAMEEEHILPLAAKYVTAQEWQLLGQHTLGTVDKKKLPVIFGMSMYEADPEVIKVILADVPLVPRLLLPILGPRAYAGYAKRIHGTAAPARAVPA